MTAWFFAHWRLVLALAITAVLALYITTLRLERDHYRDQRDALRAELQAVKAIGEKAKEEAETQIAADKAAKEKADAEHESDVAALTARIASLRARRPHSSFVPAAPSCPERPHAACLDRAELERAIRDLDAGVQGLVDQGSRAVADLDAAKRWAQRK